MARGTVWREWGLVICLICWPCDLNSDKRQRMMDGWMDGWTKTNLSHSEINFFFSNFTLDSMLNLGYLLLVHRFLLREVVHLFKHWNKRLHQVQESLYSQMTCNNSLFINVEKGKKGKQSHYQLWVATDLCLGKQVIKLLHLNMQKHMGVKKNARQPWGLLGEYKNH